MIHLPLPWFSYFYHESPAYILWVTCRYHNSPTCNMTHLPVTWLTCVHHVSPAYSTMNHLLIPARITTHLPVLWATSLYHESPACVMSHLPVSWVTFLYHMTHLHVIWITYPYHDSLICIISHLSVSWIPACVINHRPASLSRLTLPRVPFLYYESPAYLSIMTHLPVSWSSFLYWLCLGEGKPKPSPSQLWPKSVAR